MKIGILAYSSNNGLGIQTQALVKHLEPTKVMQVDLSPLNNARQYPERLPNSQIVVGYPKPAEIDQFLEGLDIVVVAETPLNYYMFSRARAMGIKTVQIPNWEFFDYFWYPDQPIPDMMIAPSMWHYDELKAFCDAKQIKCQYMHHPVDREELPMRTIKQAKIFLHTAGKAAAHDRNGTKTVIEASKLAESDVQIIIHFQGEQGLAHQETYNIDYYRQYAAEQGGANLQIVENEFENYTDVYKDCDVLLLPRRYCGNCLPLNEALSCGMPVIMTDISPNNQFLPANWLIPAEKVSEFTPRTTIDIYGARGYDLAAKIDQFARKDESQMYLENLMADRLAQSISWKGMKDQYLKVFEALCNNQL